MYIHTDDFDSLRKVNINLLEIAIKAIDGVSENLQYFVLQTGGKGYGLEFPDEIDINTPFRMDMPRIPKPWYDNIFDVSRLPNSARQHHVSHR